MSTHDDAADQLKCVRLLSVILPDGTLPIPSNWSLHAYNFEWATTPRLDGFFNEDPTPSVPVLREQLRAYADKFGLTITEQPHGSEGLIGLSAAGEYQGVELRVWGPARPEAAS